MEGIGGGESIEACWGRAGEHGGPVGGAGGEHRGRVGGGGESMEGMFSGGHWKGAEGGALTSSSFRSVRLKMVSPAILPKMVCLRSNCWVGSKVMKNWLLLLSGTTASPVVSPAHANRPLHHTVNTTVHTLYTTMVYIADNCSVAYILD